MCPSAACCEASGMDSKYRFQSAFREQPRCSCERLHLLYGSSLIEFQSKKMTVAAGSMVKRNTFGHLPKPVAARR